MLNFPRLSYNLQRAFSIRASVLGYIGVLVALIAAIIATLFTKARVSSGELHYLPNFAEPGFNCNSTAIYPGQQFGGVAYNSSLTYVSQNSFVYSGQTLGPCTVKPGYSLQVVGPPMSWPTITLNYTVTCTNTDNSNATFSPTILNHDVEQSVSNAEGTWNATIGTMVNLNNFTCFDDESVQAYRVDTATGTIRLFPQDNIGICTYDLSTANLTQLANLAKRYAHLIVDDFTESTVNLNPLPDVLYPCTKAEKVWAPTGTIIVECYTAVAATFGPSLLIVTWLLRKATSVDRRDEDESPDEAKSPTRNFSTTAPLMKDGSYE